MTGTTLVTGGTGPVGSRLVEHLARLEEDVIVLARAADAVDTGLFRHLGARIAWGDPTDTGAMARTMMQGVDRIYHLDPGDRECDERLLEVAQSWGVERILVITDVERNKPAMSMRPEALDVRVLETRDVVGPSASDTSPVQAFVRSALEDEPLLIEGTGRARRSWLHASCVVRAARLVMSADRPNSSFAAVGGEETSVLATARRVGEHLDRTISIENVSTRTHRCRGGRLDPLPLRSLGWRPRLTLDDAIGEIAREQGWTPHGRSLRRVLSKSSTRHQIRRVA